MHFEQAGTKYVIGLDKDEQIVKTLTEFLQDAESSACHMPTRRRVVQSLMLWTGCRLRPS